MSWTKDNDISTSWYEDNINTEFGDRFNEVTEHFNVIENFYFNNMGSLPQYSEDSYISTSWSED